MSELDKTGTITLTSKVEGVDDSKRKVDAFGKSIEETTIRIEKNSTSLEKLVAKIDPVTRATQAQEQGIIRLTKARDAEIQKGGDAVKANALYATGVAALNSKLADAAKYASGAATSHGNMNMRFQEGMHSARGFAEMVAMGQNPLRAFSLEAGRATSVLLQVDQGFRASLMSALPWVVGITAISTATAIVVSHMMTMNEEMRKISSTGLAFNNQALSPTEFQSASHMMAASGSFSRTEALAAVQEWEKARTLAASTVQAGMRATVPFAEATGQKPAEAAKQLADAMKTGFDGIMELDRAYGFLKPSEVEHILNLSKQQKNAEVAKIALDAFTAQMEKAAEAGRSGGESAAISFGNAWTSALDSVVKSDGFQRLEKFLSERTMVTGMWMADKLSSPTPMQNATRRMIDSGNQLESYNNSTAWQMLDPPRRAELQKEYDTALADFNRLRDEEIAARAAGEVKKAEEISKSVIHAEEQIADARENARKAAEKFTAGRANVAGLFGPAQERAAIEQRYNEAMLSADPTKQGEAEAMRTQEGLVLSAKQSAMVNQRIHDLDLEAEAQKRLDEATGDYNATVKAQIDNEIALIRAQSGGALTKKKEDEIRAMRQDIADYKQDTISENFFLDLQSKLDAKKQALADASGRGAKSVSGLMGIPAGIEAAKRSGAISVDRDTGIADPEDIKRATTMMEEYNATVLKTQNMVFARSINPQLDYEQTVRQIEELRKHLDEYRLTEEQVTQAVIEANIKRLQASREWSDGAVAALLRYQNEATNMGKAMDTTVTSSLHSVEDGLVAINDGTKTTGKAWKDMVKSIISEAQRMLVIRPMLGSLAGLMGGAIGGIGTSGNPMAGVGASGAGGAAAGMGGMGLLGMLGGGGGLFSGIGSLFSGGGSMESMAGYQAALDAPYGAGIYGPNIGDASLNALDAGGSAAGSSGFMDGIGSFFSGFFASGTDNAPPGLALVGENGPELMQMGGGERIYPNSETAAMLRGGSSNDNSQSNYGGHTINNHFHGVTADDAQAIAEKVATQVSDNHWQSRGPALANHATTQAVTKVADYTRRGGRYGNSIRGT